MNKRFGGLYAPDEATRFETARDLPAKDPEVAKALLALIDREESTQVISAALNNLAFHEVAEGVPVSRRLLAHRYFGVRMSAAILLGALQDAESVETLRGLAGGDPHEEVRREAANAVKVIDGTWAEGLSANDIQITLEGIVEESDEAARGYLVYLAGVNDPTLPGLLRELRAKVPPTKQALIDDALATLKASFGIE